MRVKFREVLSKKFSPESQAEDESPVNVSHRCPLYPSLQTQLTLPGVLTQLPLLHNDRVKEHSSISGLEGKKVAVGNRKEDRCG